MNFDLTPLEVIELSISLDGENYTKLQLNSQD